MQPPRNKRQRELERLDHRREKEARRVERKKQKDDAPKRGPNDVDPDIAHIVPGPQPLPEQ